MNVRKDRTRKLQCNECQEGHMQCQQQEGDTLRRQHPMSGVFSESRRGRDDKNGEEGEEGR